MASDIVERLRRYAPATTKPNVAAIMDEAADEIEALRAALEHIGTFACDEGDEVGAFYAVTLAARYALKKGTSEK